MIHGAQYISQSSATDLNLGRAALSHPAVSLLAFLFTHFHHPLQLLNSVGDHGCMRTSGVSLKPSVLHRR